MARSLLLLVALAIVLHIARAFPRKHGHHDTDLRGYCTTSKNELVPVGHVFHEPGLCVMYACEEGGHAKEAGSCDWPEAKHGCLIEYGEGQYPDCCPHVLCPVEDHLGKK